jgi:hypothetical protein
VAGDYVIRVALGNGQHVNFNMKSAQQGTITGLTLKYNETYVAHGATTTAPTVKWVDAAGVGRDATKTDLTWSLSDATYGSLATDGKFTATTNDKKLGKVTVTAIDTSRNVVASFDLTVGSPPATLALVAKDAVTEVSKAATVTAKLLNSEGDAVGFGTDSSYTRAMTVSILSKPAGAMVSTTQPNATDVNNGLERTGTVDFTVTSDTAGDVVVQVIVDNADTSSATSRKYYAKSITLSFGAPKPPKTIQGAQSVTMFVGARGFVADGVGKTVDFAPFIENGRTFVPVRFLAESFGAAADWRRMLLSKWSP